MQVAGFSPIPAALAGLIVWAAHFGLIYGANAVACARGLAGGRWLGLPLVPALVLGLTALALLAVAVIGLRAWQRLEGGLSGQEGENEPRFMVWLTLAIALLSALAILWEALPVLLVPACA
ncbi:hypothetical protein JMJ55_08050 [Belnapia sp. T6]|uniref:Tripartite tricarboxylate transporter TctB family protein n=1 Tax=Belnapia mucosa TaxID=2804532 RepID=A0ABS1V0S2_9PROT|nr:hypothetical protein [Belnapia mucosa]MBL6455270.1 hypothetical protein [Belnapia mucosa]